MSLTALLTEIEKAAGPVTGIELAVRLGVSPGQVAAMLDALRASGRLGPETRASEPMDTCSSSGACSMTCPGPDECALTVDLNITGLEIQPLSRQ